MDLGRFDINLVVMFGAVQCGRNVTRAADRLHLSPPALSRALGRLRLLCDGRLFVRGPADPQTLL